MLKEIDEKLQVLEDTKRYLIRHVDSLSTEERERAPKPGQMSPIQVLAHVVLVEETVTGPFVSDTKNRTVSLKGYLFMLTAVALMRFGCRIPTLPYLSPKGPQDYEATKRRWEEARINLRRKLERVTARSKKIPIAFQPMAGPMTADMVLEFLNVHLRYHWKHFPKSATVQLPLVPKPAPKRA